MTCPSKTPSTISPSSSETIFGAVFLTGAPSIWASIARADAIVRSALAIISRIAAIFWSSWSLFFSLVFFFGIYVLQLAGKEKTPISQSHFVSVFILHLNYTIAFKTAQALDNFGLSIYDNTIFQD